MPVTDTSLPWLVYISASAIPSRSANSVHVMRMCESFAETGYRVTLVARQSGEYEALDPYDFYGTTRNFDVVRLGRPPIRWVGGAAYAMQAVRWIRSAESQPAIVYSRHVHGALLASALGYPVIYEIHKPPHNFAQALAERTLFKRRSFRGLVVVTKALEAEMARIYPAIADRILTAPDAAEDMSCPSGTANSFRIPGSLNVGYVGSLFPGKGVEQICSIAGLRPQHAFHVVGGSPEEIQRVRASFHTENVFFHGHLPHSQLPGIFSSFDVVAAPFQRSVLVGRGHDIAAWMSPLKLFEYMSAGLPILASDLNASREVLDDGVDALLLDPESPDAWAHALDQLAQDPDMARRLATNARAKWEREYTWRARAADVTTRFAGPLGVAGTRSNHQQPHS